MSTARVAIAPCLILALLAFTVGPAAAADDPKTAAAWRKIRPDAPEEPKADKYIPPTKMPEGWTPPTREELDKLPWKPGRVADGMEIGRQRAAKIKPLVTVAEALKLRNDSPENNAKIVSAVCQYPASDDEVDWDATMNRQAGAPNTLNPLLSSSKYESEMNSLHAAGLFTFDHELQPFADADAVKRWLRTDTADLVEMRDDLTWEDGTPYTAYDVEFSYHVIMDPRIPVPAQRHGTSELKWVKAYDPQTIVFFHPDAKVTNVWNVNFTVIPKHIYERSLTQDPSLKASEWHAYWNRRPLSGGPYRVTEFATGQHVTFERRDDYYIQKGKQVRRRPYFKMVRFKLIDDPNAELLALKKGDLDEVNVTARQWQMQTNDDDFYKATTKVRGPEWTYSHVVWNTRRPYFEDKRVRRALAYALDIDELLKKVYFDLYVQCVGPFNPDSAWGTPDVKPIKQDLDEAEKLLEEAGWKDSDGDGVRDHNGVKFEFTFLVPQGGTGDKVGEVLKQNLKDIGINMNMKVMEWAAFSEKTHNHDFDAATAAWGTGTDPDSSENVWTTNAWKDGRNYGGYSNARVDELFEKGKYEFDFEKRRKIYQEINRILYEDQPYLFILYRTTFWAFSKDCRGYNFSPRDPMSYGPGFMQIWKPKKRPG